MNDNRGLWRGKRVDYNDWVEGDLQLEHEKGKPYYLITDRVSHWAWLVDQATLGECTGLIDKNGKLIFEGDVVKTKKYGKIVGHSNVNDYDIFVVKYEPAMFMLKNHNRGFNLVDDGYSKLEVIGNIHDNPKLARWKDGDNND